MLVWLAAMSLFAMMYAGQIVYFTSKVLVKIDAAVAVLPQAQKSVVQVVGRIRKLRFNVFVSCAIMLFGSLPLVILHGVLGSFPFAYIALLTSHNSTFVLVFGLTMMTKGASSSNARPSEPVQDVRSNGVLPDVQMTTQPLSEPPSLSL